MYKLSLCQVFSTTSMQALRRKSILLTGYLEHLIRHHYSQDPGRPHKPHVHIITPSDPEQRGCQLSLSFPFQIRKVFQELEKRGVVVSRLKPLFFLKLSFECQKNHLMTDFVSSSVT